MPNRSSSLTLKKPIIPHHFESLENFEMTKETCIQFWIDNKLCIDEGIHRFEHSLSPNTTKFVEVLSNCSFELRTPFQLNRIYRTHKSPY